MKSKFNKEEIDDLSKSYGMDISKEIEDALVQELNNSIDKEIIDKIMNIGIRSKLDSLLKKIVRRNKIDDLLDD